MSTATSSRPVHCHKAHKSRENICTDPSRRARRESAFFLPLKLFKSQSDPEMGAKCYSNLPDGDPHRRVLIVVAHLSKRTFSRLRPLLSPALLIFTMFFCCLSRFKSSSFELPSRFSSQRVRFVTLKDSCTARNENEI